MIIIKVIAIIFAVYVCYSIIKDFFFTDWSTTNPLKNYQKDINRINSYYHIKLTSTYDRRIHWDKNKFWRESGLFKHRLFR